MLDEPIASTLGTHGNNRTQPKRTTPDLRVARQPAEGRNKKWIRA